MIDSLENICMDNICLNLYLNYSLCEKNSYKIPGKWGQLIFDNSFVNLSQFSNNDVKFFNKDILELKNVNLYRKQFKTIEYFDFLNGHNLDFLHIGNIQYFNLKNNSAFSLTVKDLKIGNLNYLSTDSIYLSKQLLTNCIVTKSIKTELKNHVLSKDIFYTLLKNTTDTLESIESEYFEIFFEDLKELKNFLNKKKLLIELRLNLNLNIYKNKINDKKLKEFFISISTTVNYVDFSINPDNKIIFKCLPILIKNLKCLKYLFIDKMTSDKKLLKNIFDTITNFHNLNLTNIDFTFTRICPEMNILIGEFLKVFHQLKTVNVTCECSDKNSLDYQAIDSLQPSSNSISSFLFSFHNSRLVAESFQNFFQKCTSLTLMNLGLYLNHKLNPSCICSALDSSKNSINLLNISSYRFNQDFSLYLPALSNLQVLDKIVIKFTRFQENSLKNLLFALGNSSKRLKEFTLTYSHLTKADYSALGNFLELCPCLQKIDLEGNTSLKIGIKDTLTGLESSKTSLQQIDFSNSRLNDEAGYLLANFLRNCPSMVSISLRFNKMSIDCQNLILNSLISSKRTLKKINFGSDVQDLVCAKFFGLEIL